jgi:acetylornithine deacetylase/succinyl-diaminopimelate desuccinylase-like protein
MSVSQLHFFPMRKDQRFLLALVVCLVAVSAAAQDTSTSAVRAWRKQHEGEIVRQFAALLAVPNVASDAANIQKNAEAIAASLRARGAEARLLPVAGAPPVVFGELKAPGAAHTLIFYAHYDGQPVDPAQWTSPPWSPRLLDGPVSPTAHEIPLTNLQDVSGEARIYARGAGDDKAPIQAMLSALDAMAASGQKPSVNLKFFFEGEEEAGSPHLRAAIEQYRDLLLGDAWVLCDGPVHQTRKMQVYFGARGVTDLEMTLYGPARSLHSGHYGNWAPNPAAQIASLLASLRDRNGHITIPGYSSEVRPLTPTELAALRAAPDVDTQLKSELALGWTESASEPLAMAITHPALNIRGIEVGHVGSKAQNAISTEARASIDFRLVPDQTPQHVRETVEAYLKQQGFYLVDHAPSLDERRAHARVLQMQWGPGYPAARVSMDLPFARAVVASIEQAEGAPVIRMPMLGGSIPMYLFPEVLKSPVMGLPIANHDDNQHAPDENLRLQNLWDGIETIAAIFTSAEKNCPK